MAIYKIDNTNWNKGLIENFVGEKVDGGYLKITSPSGNSIFVLKRHLEMEGIEREIKYLVEMCAKVKEINLNKKQAEKLLGLSKIPTFV